MDYAMQSIHNCMLINLEDMLQNGTEINGVMIEKPHKFLTAMTIATQIITAVNSLVLATRFLWLSIAPLGLPVVPEV